MINTVVTFFVVKIVLTFFIMNPTFIEGAMNPLIRIDITSHEFNLGEVIQVTHAQ
jgi:hypothetical protein